MAFMCHDQLSTSVKIPNLITHRWTLPMPPLPPQHPCALAPPSSLMKSAWRWLPSLPPSLPPPFPCLSVSSLESNMPSSCISKQVQGTALPKPRQARGTHVARWLWHAADRRRQGQTIGGVSRWLFDFSLALHRAAAWEFACGGRTSPFHGKHESTGATKPTSVWNADFASYQENC